MTLRHHGLMMSGAGGGPTDPSFSSVVLLLHLDDANGATTTTDSSSAAHAMTFAGTTTPQITTAQSKFGTSSLNMTVATGVGRVSSPDSANWDFGSGQFTVEGWVRYSSAPGSNVYAMAAQWTGSSTQVWFFGNVLGNIAFYYSANGSSTSNVGAAWTPSLNTWYHIAVDRDASNVLRVYVDGVVKASATVSTTFFDANAELGIGNCTQATTAPLPGFIDEVRITKGVARYAGAFTPPTAAFPNA